MEQKISPGTRLLEMLLHLHGRLPLGWQRRFGRFTGALVMASGYRRDVVYTNIARSFPEMNYDQVRATAKQFYAHFGKVFGEMTWFGAYKGEKARERLVSSHIVEISNPELINSMLQRNPNMVILQSHTGNWELIGGIQQYAYNPEGIGFDPSSFCVTYAPVHNGKWDQIMHRNRTSPVSDKDFKGYIDSNHILRFALSNRGNKMVYTFITDQYPYVSGNSRVNFMHQDTIMMTGGTALAVKLNMSVVYLRFMEKPDGNYTITFVPISEGASGDDPESLMRQYYKLLEEDLKAQPWNYLWTHKRWK